LIVNELCTFFREQQKIIEMQESYSIELAQAEMVVNLVLLDSVTNFLNRFNHEHNFDYILGYNKAGNIFLTNPEYDLTDIVVEGLNTEYADKYGEE